MNAWPACHTTDDRPGRLTRLGHSQAYYCIFQLARILGPKRLRGGSETPRPSRRFCHGRALQASQPRKRSRLGPRGAAPNAEAPVRLFGRQAMDEKVARAAQAGAATASRHRPQGKSRPPEAADRVPPLSLRQWSAATLCRGGTGCGTLRHQLPYRYRGPTAAPPVMARLSRLPRDTTHLMGRIPGTAAEPGRLLPTRSRHDRVIEQGRWT